MTLTKESTVMENSTNRTITTFNAEVENVEEAARENASFEAALVFKKGEYFVDEQEVPVGSEFLAHPEAWVKVWRKYDGEKTVQRHVYNMAKGEKPPKREALDSWESKDDWPTDDNGEPFDPWALLYLIPFENAETSDYVVFSTRSYGGQRAVSDLAVAWARRCRRVANCGLPKIKLAVTTFYSKKAKGDVKRPLFTIVGWEDRDLPVSAGTEVPPPTDNKMNDAIPF
jgi:hypothetical protein